MGNHNINMSAEGTEYSLKNADEKFIIRDISIILIDNRTYGIATQLLTKEYSALTSLHRDKSFYVPGDRISLVEVYMPSSKRAMYELVGKLSESPYERFNLQPCDDLLLLPFEVRMVLGYSHISSAKREEKSVLYLHLRDINGLASCAQSVIDYFRYLIAHIMSGRVRNSPEGKGTEEVLVSHQVKE